MFRREQLTLVVLFGLAAATLADESASPADGAIRVAAEAYVAAFNQHDAATLGQLWSEQAVYVDRTTGERSTGRAEIQAAIAEVFQTNPDIRLQFDAGSVRFIRPDVAQAEATATLLIPDADPQVVGVSAIYVKTGDAWLLDSVEETAVPQPESAAAALADLEWLIGDWRDETENVTATSSFRWGAAGSYLIRSFSVAKGDAAAEEGTQVIGWDPLARQIRSWTFHSDGSFGEAFWSRSGGDWMIKSTQTLADGGTASGTYVLTPVDASTMTVQLIGHEVNGESQAAGEPIRVVKVEAAAAQKTETDATAPNGGAQ